MKHTRREWLSATAGGAMARAQTANRPNILFVLSDDHSTPYVGCYGSGTKTPNLDAFARSGMIFDRMFTVAPQCVPSRAGYLTGRSAVAARNTRFSSALPPDEITLPEVLRGAGYYTGVCGRGFHLDGSGRLGNITEGLMQKLKMRTWDRRVDYLDRGSDQEKVVEHLQAFLDKAPKGSPFFLWMNYSDPHHVWTTKIEGMQHDPAALKLPPHLPDLPGVRSDLARYLDEVTHCDRLFADALAILKRRGLEQNTLVMFCGDNGMAFPHGKGSLYDPGLNVPMLVRWPGVVKPGARTAELVSGEDVAPTLIEAAGAKVPSRMSGLSILPLLKGQRFSGRKHIFAERGPHGGSTYTLETKASSFDQSRCVRSAKWKLIYNCTPHQEYQPVDSANDPGWKEIVAAHEAGRLRPEHEKAYFTRPRPVYELFDLDNDPGELNNLAGKQELREVEQALKVTLTEKMMLDYDYLPLPIPSTQ
jgi:N-sulfoglucosamine sulfohydrolase